MTEADHLDAVELRLAKTQDELRRTRLELVRAIANAKDALNALYTGDIPAACYNLMLVLSLHRPEKEGF